MHTHQLSTTQTSPDELVIGSASTLRAVRTLAAVAVPILTACGVDAAPEQDDAQVHSEATAELQRVTNVLDGIGEWSNTVPPSIPPADATEYVPQGRLVRITSEELNFALMYALGQSRIVVDTLGTSPTLYAPYYHCSYPNQAIRESMIAECKSLPKPAWRACLLNVNEEYPNIHDCAWTTAPYHSYFDFGGNAERLGASDVGFDIREITRDSWGPGSTIVNLNYIHQTVNANTAHAWFSPEPNHRGAANFSLTLTSNQPTIDCRHTVFACPNIELTNMKIVASLTHVMPVSGDPYKLGYDHVDATFTFDRNLNNAPDDLVTLFVDIDAIIRNNVQSQVKKALERSGSRDAISKALTELARRNAVERNGSAGIDWFYGAFGLDDGSLMVDYQPCPRAGCGIRAPVGPVATEP